MLTRLILVPVLLLPVVLVTGCGKGDKSQTAATGAASSGGKVDSGNAGNTKKLAAASEATSSGDGSIHAAAMPEKLDGAVGALVGKAQQALANGQSATAIEALSQAIGINAADGRLFRWRAEVYSSIGEHANARADLSMAIQVDPNNAELHNLRGYFLMTHGAPGDAAADFDRSIELNPKLAAAWNNRGLLRLAAGKHDLAEQDFSMAIKADAQYADAWNNRGFARLKSGQSEEAKSDLQQAVKLNPEYATAWNNLGLVFMEQENFQAAADAFDKAVAQAPLDARWVSHRRAALLKLERYEEAGQDAQTLRWLQQLSSLTEQANAWPKDVKSWLNRAAHLVEMKQYAAAAADYTRALQVSPANTEALNGRAFVWVQTGAYKQAVADCDESLVVQATTEAFSLRGDAWLAMDNLDQAIADFESARRFDPVVAEAYSRRAAKREADGQQEEADADRKMAAEITAGLNGKVATSEAEPIPFPSTN